jgi:CheY-like chemotaxis protein
MPCLVVDDNRPFAENLAEIIQDLGLPATIATSGREALGALAASRFRLLLCDFRMPEMDGAEFIRLARIVQPGLPAILITAFANDAEVARAVGHGEVTVLPKPVPMDALKRAVTGTR